MKRWLLIGLLCGLGGLWLHGEPTEREIREEKYGPSFYGIELPETGANVLLVVDISKSMGRKDASRTDGGRRWDTLVDEVTSLCDQMTLLIAERRVHFAITLLYEGGEQGHPGTEAYVLAEKGAKARLLQALQRETFAAGGSFEKTFGETLWKLVARDHVTHLFYLGDNDIGKYADTVEAAVGAWYTLPKEKPSAQARALWSLKKKWYQPWERWRKPVGQGRLTFKRQQSLPPPPKEVVFHAIAIGQKSPLLKRLADLGSGTYIERLPKKKKKRQNR